MIRLLFKKCVTTICTLGWRAALQKSYTYLWRYYAVSKKLLFTQRLQLSTAPGVCNGRPAYAVFTHDKGGGAEFYVQQHIKKIQHTHNVFVIRHIELKNIYYVDCECGGVHSTFKTKSFDTVIKFLQKNAVEIVFCNNFVGYPNIRNVLDKIISLRARIEFFIHDYYVVCPNCNLIGRDGIYCRIPRDFEVCTKCLCSSGMSSGKRLLHIDGWRTMWGNFLDRADIIIVPDRSVAEILHCVFPQLRTDINIIQHAPVLQPRPVSLPLPDSPCVIGIIGHITANKGAHILLELYDLIKKDNVPCQLVVIGSCSADMRDRSIVVTGRYTHTQLPMLLEQHRVSMCLVPSICPETFCYVAQEVEMLGLPLVCFDLGAQANRAKAYDKGYVVPHISASACLAVITQVERQRLIRAGVQ